MTTIVTGVDIGIVIVGAIIVVGTAFLVVKSTSKMGVAQTQKQPVEYTETPVAVEKRRAPTLGLALNRLKSPLGLALRKFSRQPSNATPDQQPIDEGLAINEQFSIPLSGVTSSEPEVNTVPSSPAEPEQWLPDVEPANEKEPEADRLDTLPEEPAESTQDLSQEEPEETRKPEEIRTPEEPEEPGETPGEEYEEQPKPTGSAFDLFTAEMAEESEVSKFAATLNNVDIHHLLEEARTFINQLRGGWG